jgi:putative aminopeptidase FrvX
MHPALQLFTELLVPSPSGREWDLADIVRGKLDALGFAHETDGAGDVLVRIAGKSAAAPLTCFAAHMDEIGMVVTRIEPDGSLRVNRSGGLLPWKLGEGPVEILGDNRTLTGVLSFGSTHTAGNGNKPLEWEDCRVLTGLSPARLKEAGIRPGTYALPERSRRGPVIFGDEADPLVGAWTFDDRIGIVSLIRLLERMGTEGIVPAFPLMVAFTVSEEVGGHGALALVRREQPEVFVAVDGSPMPPETDLKLDGRPGIWAKDASAPYDPRLVQAFMAAAARAGTELQPVVFKSAASDASMAASGAGVPRIACVGHVRANSHGYEVIRLSVLDHVLETLVEFVRGWDG